MNILLVHTTFADDPEAEYWMLERADVLANVYEINWLTNPDLGHIEWTIEFEKIEISYHVTGKDTTIECPYCHYPLGTKFPSWLVTPCSCQDKEAEERAAKWKEWEDMEPLPEPEDYDNIPF